MAHLRTRGDRVQAIVQLDGRKISRTFATDYEAQRWADEQEGLTSPIGLQADEQTPVAVYAAAWLLRVGPLLTTATVTNYSTMVRAIAAAPFATTAIGDLRRSQVEQWAASMTAEGRLGASSVRLRIKVLRMVLRDAVADRIIDRDVTDGIRLPTVPVKIDKVIGAADDAALVAAAADDPAVLAFYLLGFDAGLRWSEIAALTPDAIDGLDTEAPYVIVRQVVEREPLRIRPFPKSHRGREVVILTDRLRDALRALLDAHEGGDRDPLFVTEAGNLLRYDVWRVRVWKPLQRRAGMAKRQVGFHSTRHTCGTRLALGGMARAEIAEFLGHADESTTARYVHVGAVESMRRSGREALARYAERAA